MRIRDLAAPVFGAFALFASGCFVAAPRPVVGGTTTISWTQNLSGIAGSVGQQYMFFCPQSSQAGNVWGTDIYSDDSSICTAAVHAGVIGWGGGMVRLVIQPGQQMYPPSMRNGVTTMSWGAWGRSFSFIP